MRRQRSQQNWGSAKSDWTDFLKNSWQKKPIHLGRTAYALTSEQIFTVVTKACQQLRDGVGKHPIRWCGDGRSVLPLNKESLNFLSYLPEANEENFPFYAKRMEAVESFFFQIPELQCIDTLIWNWILQFTSNFYPTVGVPGKLAWTDVYVGRYSRTPFGVHLDGADNFTFGIEGYKTLYLWEPGYYHKHMRSADKYDFEKHLGHAVQLKVGPGECIYWPGRYWHIASPDDKFSVTMNFAYYGDLDSGMWLSRALSKMTNTLPPVAPPSFIKSTTTLGATVPLPTKLKRSETQLKHMVQNDALRETLNRLFLEHISGLGFQHPPVLISSQKIHIRQKIKISDHVKIHGSKTKDNRLLCSANGRSIVLANNKRTRNAIQKLNSRQILSAESIARQLAENDTGVGTAILTLFANWGAIVVSDDHANQKHKKLRRHEI